MQKSKVFIASSSRTLTLAEALRNELNTSYSTATLWSDEGSAKISKTIIEMLEEASGNFDFAVVLLSADDVILGSDFGGNAENAMKRKARDNCIFEAGLFMASLGRERCFLLSSVNPEDLPKDLGGVILLKFDEPEDLANLYQCKDSIVMASTEIKAKIQEWGPKKQQRISRRLLLDRQKKMTDGELCEGQVVVAFIQPFDLTHENVEQIKKNINAGIQYLLFIPQGADAAKKVCQLLQLLLLSDLLECPGDAEDFGKRQRFIREQSEVVLSNLKDLCLDGGLKVFFTAMAPEMQYCIHNADDEMYARQYVRHGDEFLEWAQGPEARVFWTGVRQRRPQVDRPNPPTAILYTVADGQSGAEHAGELLARDLRPHIKRYFPTIEESVLRMCLHGMDVEYEEPKHRQTGTA